MNNRVYDQFDLWLIMVLDSLELFGKINTLNIVEWNGMYRTGYSPMEAARKA